MATPSSTTAAIDLRWWAGVGVGLAVASAWLVAWEIPAPRGDDAAYKSPAAEWAQLGRMIAPGLTGLLTTADQGFAHYPPLFPLVYGLWYRVWGFSLRSTLACSFTIHALHCLLAGIVTEQLLRTQHGLAPASRRALSTCVACAVFLNCAYFDRPEELGLCFVWCGYLAWGMSSQPLTLVAMAAWGVCLGLAALVAPFAGLLGALTVVARSVADVCQASTADRRRAWAGAVGRIAVAGLVSLAMACGWAIWMEWKSPGLLRDQLIAGNLAFSSLNKDPSWLARPGQFLQSLLFCPPQIPVALLGLMLVPNGWLHNELRNRQAATLWAAMVSGLACVALIRPSAYTYVGTTFMLSVPLFALGISRFLVIPSGAARVVTWVAIGLCIAAGGRDLVVSAYFHGRLPEEELAAGAMRRLHAQIPTGDLVAVAPRHWHALQGRNPWRDAFLAALRDDREILRCRWLVLYPGVGRPPYLEDFELVAQSSVSAPRDHTYAFTLWRRKDDP